MSHIILKYLGRCEADLLIAVPGFFEELVGLLSEQRELLPVDAFLDGLIILEQVDQSPIHDEGLDDFLLLHPQLHAPEVVAIEVNVEEYLDQVIDPGEVVTGEVEEPVGCFPVVGGFGEPDGDGFGWDLIDRALLGISDGSVDGFAQVGVAGDGMAAGVVRREKRLEVLAIERLSDEKVDFHAVFLKNRDFARLLQYAVIIQ